MSTDLNSLLLRKFDQCVVDQLKIAYETKNNIDSLKGNSFF